MYKLIHTNSEFLPSPAGPSPEVSSPALSPDSAPVAPGSSLGEFFPGPAWAALSLASGLSDQSNA